MRLPNAPYALRIRDFWNRTYRLPRTALVCALIAAAVNAATFAGATSIVPGYVMAIMHVAVIVLFLTLFARTGYERLLSARRGGADLTSERLPKPLVWLSIGSLVYFVALLVGTAMTYGEGPIAIPDAVALRIFSSAWMFFLLLITVLGHQVEEQIRASRRHLTRRGSP